MREWRLFIKAQAASVMATALDFGLTALLAYVGCNYVLATACGALLGALFNCVYNYLLVFRWQKRPRKIIALRYVMTWCCSLLLNTGATFVLTECLTGVSLFLGAKVIAAILVALCWNYPMQRFFVFAEFCRDDVPPSRPKN